MLIIINGSAGVGKDSFVECCRRYLYFNNSNKNIINLSSVAKVKQFCKDIMGIDPNDKSNTNRKIWHETKMKYKDWLFWETSNYIASVIKDNINNIIFFHVREIDEIKRYCQYFINQKVLTVLVRRDIKVPNNNADEQVETYDYDYVIENNGGIDDFTFKLELKAKNFIKEIHGNN